MSHDAAHLTGAHFSFSVPGSTPAANMLSMWEPSPPSASAFAASWATPQEPEPLIWRVSLPTDPALAGRALSVQRADVNRLAAALHQVMPRLDAYGSQLAQGAPVSFSAEMPRPEQALAATLAASIQPASFAPDDSRLAGAKSAAEAAQGFLAQVQQLLDAYCWVETLRDDRPIAQTRVGWTGDFDTWWTSSSDPSASENHAQAVALALASRAVWVRFAGQLLAGAIRLGRWLALPGGVITATPAIWRFINEMIDEYRRARQIVGA